MPLYFEYDITKLVGAEYNPRHIEQTELNGLCDSITKLGLIKPLIVRNNTLVAGHQRTKALRKLGITKAAVFELSADTTIYDEVRFNQLHNGTDFDGGDENVVLTGGFKTVGWHVVPSNKITGNFRSKLAPVRNEICRLILRYGSWGGVVATKSGEVIHCAQYALAAALTNSELTVFVIPDAKKDYYQSFLNKKYGVFNYDGLEKKTYIQTFAQMCRLRGDEDREGSRDNKSTLYEEVLLPWLSKQKTPKNLRGLDFGSGQGEYAAKMRKQGYDFLDLEFFRRVKGKHALDITAVNNMIDSVITSYKKYGPFDYVVCDSVLNSVDCLKAETSVMYLLNFFCKDNGHVFFSGRKTERVSYILAATSLVDNGRYVEFLDEHGFTALYRKGNWFYQKFHTKEQVEVLCKAASLRVSKHYRRNKSSTSWQLHATKERNLPLNKYVEAITYEFNLPISDDKTLNRHTDVLLLLDN